MNIAEILKYCPKGTKLYSAVHGEVNFIETTPSNMIKVEMLYNYEIFFEDGTLSRDGECVLFPSKDQRDWEKFRLPVKRGDIMMKADGTIPFIASGEFYKDTSPKYICGVDTTGRFSTGAYGWTSEFYISASEEAKKELFDKMVEAGYKWNADILELEKIEPKFKEGDVIKDNKNNLYLIVDTNSHPKIGCVLNQNMKLTILNRITTLASTKFTLANKEERNKLFSILYSLMFNAFGYK